MGGTRFVGKALVKKLLSQRHSLTLFTRGHQVIPAKVEHLKGDRTTSEGLQLLEGRSFDVIVDTSGRELEDSKRVLNITGIPTHRFLYLSSAGIYASSQRFPLNEENPLDPLSRHVGKANTENWLRKEGIPFTCFRPTYIYGPGNYNPIERWFFDRILNDRPVPLPGDGQTITQLGHVNDLADAMVRSLQVDQMVNRSYNCSGKFGVTFLGLVEAATKACGKDIESIKTMSFDPSKLDPKARKVFPLRLSHFLTDITRLQMDLDWQPQFDLEEGLIDSYRNDYLLNPTSQTDFKADVDLLGC